MTQREFDGPAARSVRQQRDMTQKRAADLLEISQGYLANLERGTKQPSQQLIHRFAQRMGVSLTSITRRPHVE